MQTWDKVTMKWNFSSMGIATSVRMDGEVDTTIYDPRLYSSSNDKLHGLFSIEAVSQPRERKDDQRKGEMVVDIRCWGRNLIPNYEALTKLLDTGFKKLTEGPRPIRQYGVRITEPQSSFGQQRSWMDTKYTLHFVLANGEHFCDSTIEIARAIFDSLGVKDEGGYSLARFTPTRETFVKIDDAWITFARWLRMSHRLPIYGPEDRP